MFIPEIPKDNSIKPLLEKIVELAKELQDKRRFVFNNSASDYEISKWENENNISLPISFADWLQFSNGSILRNTVAEFYGLDRIEFNVDGLPENYVIIGSLIGDGVLICFSKDNGNIFTDDHGEIVEYYNFGEIIEDIIEDINNMW